MTATKPTLPDHNGEPVIGAQIKFTGLGTGFQGLDVDPVYVDLDETVYFVGKATAKESPSVRRDNHGDSLWLNRLTVDSMAPIDRATAERVLSEYAAEVERKRNEVEGQMMLQAEKAAEERERADMASTGSARATNTN